MTENQIVYMKQPNISIVLNSHLKFDEVCKWEYVSVDHPMLKDHYKIDNT